MSPAERDIEMDHLLAAGRDRIWSTGAAPPFAWESRELAADLHVLSQRIADLLAVDNPTTVWR